MALSPWAGLISFADDLCYHKEICSAADVEEVQVDVTNLADEISALGLQLNSQKTKTMLVSRKRHQPQLARLWEAAQYVWFSQ